MQLLVPDRSYTDFDGDPEALRADISAIASELGEHEVGETDIGPGADWPMFLITFSAIGSVFLLGDKINKNLDAWIEIGRKLKRVLTRFKTKHGAVRIDDTGARLLAAEGLATRSAKVDLLEFLSLQSIRIHEFPNRNPNSIDSRYDALFVLVARVNDEHLYVFGIRSSGDLDFVHRYGAEFTSFRPDDPK